MSVKKSLLLSAKASRIKKTFFSGDTKENRTLNYVQILICQIKKNIFNFLFLHPVESFETTCKYIDLFRNQGIQKENNNKKGTIDKVNIDGQ